MITMLSLAILAIGILAIRARSISRSVGKLWIDLEIAATIIYIVTVWAVPLIVKYLGIDSSLEYVIDVTIFSIALVTYLLCAFKITLGLARYRLRGALLYLLPYAVYLVYLLILNPINHIAYFDDVRGEVSAEKLAFIFISTVIMLIYTIITIGLAWRHRRRLGPVASVSIIVITLTDYLLVVVNYMIRDFSFMGRKGHSWLH